MKIVIFDSGGRTRLHTGYGVTSLHFGDGLSALGHEVFYYDEHTFHNKVDVWLWIRPPHFVEDEVFNKDNINIFYTMHERETLVQKKQHWPDLLNKCDAVITPTQWNKKVWINNGVTVPIYVAPLGVEPTLFRGEKSYNFSLLSIFEGLGHDGSRELWQENIRAYFKLFYGKHCKAVNYTLKSWHIEWNKYEAFIQQLIQENKYNINSLPPIQIIDYDLTPIAMNYLYAKHWIFLKNSKGEGWCLPALETLSAGLKIISKPLPAMIYLNEHNCNFFTNYTELKQAIWENWKQYKEKKDYINSFSWESAIIKLNNVLEEIYDKAKT